MTISEIITFIGPIKIIIAFCVVVVLKVVHDYLLRKQQKAEQIEYQAREQAIQDKLNK